MNQNAIDDAKARAEVKFTAAKAVREVLDAAARSWKERGGEPRDWPELEEEALKLVTDEDP